MLKLFAKNIWIADGGEVSVIGFQYPTRMAVIKLSDGTLFIWSPTALTENLRAEIETLGTVQHIVAPNSLHHLFLNDWVTQYPDAKVYAPPGLRQKRQDINFDADLGDAVPEAWAKDMDQVLVRGNVITTETVFFHIESRTVLFTDLIQHYGPDHFTGWRAVAAKLDLMTAPHPAVPRKFRIAFTNRKAARTALEHIFTWPAEQVVMAHGPLIAADGKAFIARTFDWLMT